MGNVYFVGAGPGDPGLITLHGIELLKTCDVVIYDRLASFQLLDYVKEDCVRIYVGKEAGHHSKSQEEINGIIVKYASAYENIVRLKGGDSFVFGRGGEEIEELLKHGISFDVIPGVTSAVSVPECAGIPVTHRGMSQSFHVITGHTKSSDHTLTDNYEVLAKLDGTLVFLMGLSNIQLITNKLMEHGKNGNTPAAVLSNGTMEQAKTVRGLLKDIAKRVLEEGVVSPAVIVIGDTAELDFTSTVKKPLSGIKIGLTGTRTLREKFEKGLQKLGAKVFTVCDMHVIKTPLIAQLKEEILSLDQYNWIVFTSQNAIKIFFDEMKNCRVDRRCLSNIKFAVIGTGTGQVLQDYGFYADFIPSSYTTESLAEEFTQILTPTDKVLIPRAFRGSEELAKAIGEKGISYKEIAMYDVKGELTKNKEYVSEMDCLIFASASGVSAFFNELKGEGIKLKKDIKIACIGEVTANQVKKYQYNIAIVSDICNVDGLMNEIKHFNWNN